MLRSDYPLVRFGTGDLSSWVLGPDGAPRLAGVLGRVGQAVKVRGMFLHPAQVRQAMTGLDGVRDYRFVVERVDHKDTLRCELLLAAGVDAERLSREVVERVRDRLRFGAQAAVVDRLTAGDGPIVDTRSWD